MNVLCYIMAAFSFISGLGVLGVQVQGPSVVVKNTLVIYFILVGVLLIMK